MKFTLLKHSMLGHIRHNISVKNCGSELAPVHVLDNNPVSIHILEGNAIAIPVGIE